ncbi:VOC family protein, partial [Streptomyces sp. NPDC006339]|uniref:VOC family protein n=1 Tax=Streptomyces sp. NPDC006339 TaxID=3156755 RepID=UPI0033B399D8
MRTRVQEIVFDCADPAALARFWAALLGGAPVDRVVTGNKDGVARAARLVAD